MNYGDILINTFKLLWKEKKLWVIAAVGALIYSMLLTLYMSSLMGFQITTMTFLSQWDETTTGRFLAGSLIVAILMGIMSLVGYVVNLIARAGVAEEAHLALQEESVDIGRGLRHGLRKAPTFFVIDLIWALPILLVGTLIVVMGIGGLVGAIAYFEQQGKEFPFFGFFGGMLTFLGGFICISLLYGAIRGIFAPLMYQVAVKEGLGAGDAIRRGWNLARSHLAPMLFLWLLLLGVQLAMSMLFRVLTMPFTLFFMSAWMGTALNGSVPSSMPFSPGWVLIGILTGFFWGVLMWLWMSFYQALYYTYYARVYQILTRSNEQESVV